MRLRCIEEGIIFSHKEVKFKILSCYPRQGFIVKLTRLHLYTEICNDPISEVEILPLPPHSISEELFDSVFLPYFSTNKVHLHSNQHIYIYGLECIVSKTEPHDGFVVPSITEFNYCEYPIPSITKLSLVPYIEDIPSSLSRLEEPQLIKTIMDMYLMPYLKGWRRILRAGMVIDIGGIDFKVRDIMPDGGLTDADTVIYYNGKAISRRRNPVSPHQAHQLRELVRNLEAFWIEKKEKKEKLPSFIMKNVPEDADQRTCVICLSEFVKGCKVTTFPCCKNYLVHIFHKACSEKWLNRHQVCPTCKTQI